MRFTQKQIGLAAIALGAASLLVISGIFMMRPAPIQGFPMLLPAGATVLYGELPLSLPEGAARSIEGMVGFNIRRDSAHLEENSSAAIALIKKGDTFSPILFVAAKDPAAFKQLLDEKKRPARLINSTVALAKTEEDLAFLTETFSPLGTAPNFIAIRRELAHNYFIYAQPESVQSYYYNLISRYLPSLLAQTAAPDLGVGFDVGEKSARGTMYSISNAGGAALPAQPFTAQLLPFIPAEFEQIFGGVDLTRQLEHSPSALMAASSIAAQYLPGLDFRADIAPVLEREFAVSMQSNHVVAVFSVPAPIANDAIPRLRAAFRQAAPFLIPAKREVALPDGSAAYEYVPDRSAVREVDDEFEGVPIHGFMLGNKEAYFDAFVNDKWFVSNDIIGLKQALALIKNGGASAYDSARYKEALRPLFKNPELYGSAPVKITGQLEGQFTFAKRSFSDHSESEFLLAW